MTQKTENKQSNREEDYRHRHIDIDIRQKERRFYIPYNWLPTIKKLEEILKRDGSNISRWVRQQADSYVRLHDPGNPQQLLTKVILEGKPYWAEVCFICGEAAVHQIKHKNLIRYACPLHRAQALESGKWSDVENKP